MLRTAVYAMKRLSGALALAPIWDRAIFLGSPYEPPEDPELRLLTLEEDADALADALIEMLHRKNVIWA
jgi:hypothetical protein